jgi:hypothetical protein
MPNPKRRRGLAAARQIAVELTPQTVEQIASRVAQLLLRHHQLPAPASLAPAPAWMTAKELAHHLKLNPAWVYEHADELGAIRTGNGPKARIRFNLHTATQALKQHQRQPTPAATGSSRTPPRPVPYPSDAPLLDIRGPYRRSVRGCLGWTRTPSRGRLGVS